MADAKCKGRESVCTEIGTFLFIPRYMVDVDRFVVRNTLGHDHRSLKTEAFVAARTLVWLQNRYILGISSYVSGLFIVFIIFNFYIRRI